MVFQLVEVGVVGPVVGEILVGAERIEIGEHGVALHLARVVHPQVVGVGIHRAHLLPHVLSRVAQVYAVAQALAHLLLAVGAGQTARRGVFGQHDVGLHEHLAVCRVEAAHQFARNLKHRLLVFAGRHRGGLEQRDVGRLAHRVAEEAQRNVGLKVAHLYLRLHRGVALYAAHRDEVHQISGQFGQLRYLALHENGAFLRVESGCEIVQRHLYQVLPYLLRVVSVVGQRLHVGHEHEHLLVVTLVLQLHPSAERAYVMPQVELAGGPVAREYHSFHLFLFLFVFCLSPKPLALAYAKPMQASGKKTCFRFPERSLAYAKVVKKNEYRQCLPAIIAPALAI